jgi:DNA-binding helix-turn-helix protein
VKDAKRTVKDFGKATARHLSARRAHQRITQMQLAELTGISQSQLSKQLRGLRSIDIDEFERICNALSVPMEEILKLAAKEIQEANNSKKRQAKKLHVLSPDDGWQYEEMEEMAAADDSPDEPMPGDDDYHDGP